MSDRVKESYGAVPETVIAKTLGDMIENEFLISDLRIPAYCVDPLAYIIQKLDEIEYSGHYLFELRKMLEIVSWLQLPISHSIFLHPHKRGIVICFRVTVAFAAYVYLLIVFFETT